MASKQNILWKFLLILLLTVSFSSCINKKGRITLERAEILLADYPDSAARALDSILYPERMGKAYYMKYLVVSTQAKYKTYREVRNDTAVMKAARYFERKDEDKELTAEAFYTAGVVLKERDDIDNALAIFKQAAQFAETTENYLLQGLVYENLGYLYQEELSQEQGITHYKKALSAYQKETDTELKQLNTLSFIAANYATNQQPDSALVYFYKALTIADSVESEYYQALTRNNIGTTYQQMSDYSRSNQYLKDALRYNPETSICEKIILNLAENYLQLHDNVLLENALEQLKQSLEKSDDLYYQSAVFDLLMRYEERVGGFSQALAYSKEINQIQDSIYNQNQSKALIEAEKKFDYSQKENEVKLAKQQQRAIKLRFSLLLLSVIGGGVLIRFRARQKQQLKVFKLEYEKAAQEIKNRELKERLKQYVSTNDQYKLLIRSTSELHKTIYDTAQAGEVSDKSNRFKKIKKVLTDTETTVLENMSSLSRAFLLEQGLLSTKILDQISETDIIVLFMLYNKESRNDIAALLSTNPHALTQRISRLKNKLKDYLTDTESRVFFS